MLCLARALLDEGSEFRPRLMRTYSIIGRPTIAAAACDPPRGLRLSPEAGSTGCFGSTDA